MPPRPARSLLAIGALVAGLFAFAPAAHADEPPALITGNVAAWGDRDPANDLDGDGAYGYADNYYGQQDIPTDIADKRITAVAASSTNSIALDSDGKVYVWGWPGIPENGWGTAPPADLANKTVTAVDAFDGALMALDSTGSVHVWGNTSSDIPPQMSGKTVTAIADGGARLALTKENGGKAYAWGSNSFGEADVPAEAQSDVIAIAGDRVSSLALKADGSIIRWGSSYGTVPTPDPGRHFVDISAGGDNQYAALDDAGKVYTWGYFAPTPPPVLDDKQVVSIDVGNSMIAAVTAQGEFVVWGFDGYDYDHGIGCPSPSCTAADNSAYTPADVASRGVIQVAVGKNHVVAALQTPVVNAAAPTITGRARVGETLTSHTGTWQPLDASRSVQWHRDGTPISGATGSTYVPTVTDLGKRISVTITATHDGYVATTLTAVATSPVAPGLITSPRPVVKGKARAGRKLTVVPGSTKPPGVTITYQWLRKGKAIKGAVKATYKVTKKDRAKKLSVRVTRTKPGYTTLKLTSKKVKVRK